ncbi:MAG: 30S ribosomal protein S17 [Candidatus Liptonbacteria bacterium]|nr:30S ribosomal protein S17 [Candidatus Liptonbacteria bacterium]
MMQQTTKKRTREGIVVSDRMQKTRVVAISREKKHAKYLKYHTVTTRVKAHDEQNEYKTGDRVRIEETRPLSKDKRWRIIGVIANNANKGK